MSVSPAKRHSRYLRWAELQFLLAHKVNTLTVDALRLDQPTGWTYGNYSLSRDELTLSYDDATLASAVLHHSAAFALAVHIVSAFKNVVGDVRKLGHDEWQAAFEIARLIRNSYTHHPADPHWFIDPHCQNQIYAVQNIICINTAGLQGKEFEWQNYGGPISLYHLSEFVRTQILPACEHESVGRDDNPAT